MASDKKDSAYEKLLPVVVGAILGAVPAIVVSQLQARSAVHQVVIERQFTAITDFSAACSRRVHLVKRLVFLSEVKEKTTLRQTPAGEEHLIRQYEALNREIEDAKVGLQAQVDLVNALFGTQLATPPETESEAASLSDADTGKLVDALRRSIPSIAQQCAEAAKLLISKLEK